MPPFREKTNLLNSVSNLTPTSRPALTSSASSNDGRGPGCSHRPSTPPPQSADAGCRSCGHSDRAPPPPPPPPPLPGVPVLRRLYEHSRTLANSRRAGTRTEPGTCSGERARSLSVRCFDWPQQSARRSATRPCCSHRVEHVSRNSSQPLPPAPRTATPPQAPPQAPRQAPPQAPQRRVPPLVMALVFPLPRPRPRPLSPPSPRVGRSDGLHHSVGHIL